MYNARGTPCFSIHDRSLPPPLPRSSLVHPSGPVRISRSVIHHVRSDNPRGPRSSNQAWKLPSNCTRSPKCSPRPRSPLPCAFPVSACGSTTPPLASSVARSLLSHFQPILRSAKCSAASVGPNRSLLLFPNTSSGSAAEPSVGTLPAPPRGSNPSSRTAVLQTLRSFPSIPLPESLRLPVTQLQYLCRIGQPKRLALHPPQYLCSRRSSLVLIAVLFNRTSSGGLSVGNISNEGRRGHYQRGATALFWRRVKALFWRPRSDAWHPPGAI